MRELGIDHPFVQDNHSHSAHGVVRGLHVQAGGGQAKIVRCARGRIFDVVVDVRPPSPRFGMYQTVILDDVNHRQMYIPVGFAHGFAVLSDAGADVTYRCSSYYDAGAELTIAHDDPAIGIEWPSAQRHLSARDADAPCLADIRDALVFGYRTG